MYTVFFRPTLDYADIIYDKRENESFKDWLETIQYKAALAITGAIRDTSRKRIYNEHDLDSLADKPGGSLNEF